MQRLIPPALAGDHVTLREFSTDDAALVRSVANDPLIPYVTTLPAGADDAELDAYIDRQRRRARNGEGWQFVITETSTGTAVGQIGLTYRDKHRERASLGYWISPAHRGRGFAASALEVVTAWAAARRTPCTADRGPSTRSSAASAAAVVQASQLVRTARRRPSARWRPPCCR